MAAARKQRAKRESLFKQYAKSVKSAYAILFVIVLVMTFGLADFEAVFGLYVAERYGFTAQHISTILTA